MNMQMINPKKLVSYTRAFGQDYSRPCFSIIADDHFSITKQGEIYLDEYNCTAVADLKRKGFQYAVLKFLHNSNGRVKIDYFPKFLKDSCPPITDGYKELDLMQYLGYTEEMKPYIEGKNHFYGLSAAGRKLYEIENRKDIKQQPIFELTLLDLGL